LILAEFLQDLSDALFPPLCIFCMNVLALKEEKIFCASCNKQIVYLTNSHCTLCGKIFPDSPADDHLCGDCLQSKPFYDLARSAVAYDGVMHEVILQFKYGRNIVKGTALADLLAGFIFPDIDWPSFDCIIPVPLHIRRLRSRGFNQSLILARALGKKHHLPVEFSLLKRRKMTHTQIGLNQKEREQNIKNAFEVSDPKQVAGQHIILVDDVLTTGSTVNECAKTLKKEGAARVVVVTLARVV